MSRQPKLFEPEEVPIPEEIREATSEWRAYKLEQWGFTYRSPRAVAALVKRLARFEAEGLAEGLGAGEALRAVEHSAYRLWEGVFREPMTFQRQRELKAVRELQAPGLRSEPPVFEIVPRLAALASAVPDGLKRIRQQVVGLEKLADEMGPEAVEDRLQTLDGEMLTAAREALNGAETEISASVDKTLNLLRGRLPAAEVGRQRERLFAQALRRRLQLPVLSLFSPEAEP
jgi:hypothetical protein